MKKIPISLIVDDSTPIISISYYGARYLSDGMEKVARFSLDLLFDFCRVVEEQGIRGKFSIVPMPAAQGDNVSGINGVSRDELDTWLDTVRRRIAPRFAICPEMLTHSKAIDLATGAPTDIREDEWSQTQSRETLTPYITRAVELVRDAGFSVRGVTSPWDFGIKVEDDYAAAISDAVYSATSSHVSWYFLHCIRDTAGIRPWIAIDDGDRTVVTIPVNTRDHVWKTLESTRTDDEFISSLADGYITSDGTDGEIVRAIRAGSYPMILTHWQSLMSNGTGIGIRVIEEVAHRVNERLSDVVEWTSFEKIVDDVVSDKDNYQPYHRS